MKNKGGGSGSNSKASRIKRAKKAKAKAAANARPKLSKADAVNAVKKMGFGFNAKGQLLDSESAQNAAQGAATSAASAMGINIMNPDGTIDTDKARQAVSVALGFDIDNMSASQTADAIAGAKNAALETSKSLEKTLASIKEMSDSMNVEITKADGSIDKKKAAALVDLVLDIEVADKRKLGNREAMDALNIQMDSFTQATGKTRKEASEVIEKLLSSNVIEDGQISKRKALAERDRAIRGLPPWQPARPNRREAKNKLEMAKRSSIILGQQRNPINQP